VKWIGSEPESRDRRREKRGQLEKGWGTSIVVKRAKDIDDDYSLLCITRKIKEEGS